jgi:hypothetical protein
VIAPAVDRFAQSLHAHRASIVTSQHIEVIRHFAFAHEAHLPRVKPATHKERVMKKAATAFAIVLALTATASARPRHHRPVAAGTSTIDSGYSAPRNWNEIEVSVPSGGF